ncbi:kinase-like domain-containing protein [Apiospora sp. TS-2023a]
MLEGNQLFRGIDPEHHKYQRRAHLAEIVALLGPPPKDLLARGHLATHSLNLSGTLTAGIDLLASTSLEELETHLAGDEKRRFLEFMRKMLQWAPERRSTAGELFQDRWLQGQT